MQLNVSDSEERNSPYIYQLKVWIYGVKPMIWRRVLVRADSTIADLHYTIQIAMGWSDSHLNKFHIHGKDYGVTHIGGINFSDDPEKVYLSSFNFQIHEQFLYEYDFGDDWLHEIRVEKLLVRDSKKTYPLCIDGKNAAPPEDCGGAPAYMHMKHELEYKAMGLMDDDFDDGESDEDKEVFDPEKFSRSEVNERLKKYADGDRDWLFSY